jgi:hypothetical protein
MEDGGKERKILNWKERYNIKKFFMDFQFRYNFSMKIY